MTVSLRPVAIVGGNRIPFVRSNSTYRAKSNQDMLTASLQGVVDRFDLKGQTLGLVAGGAVIKHARDYNLVRESVLGTSLSPHTPAFDVQHACNTSFTAASSVADAIALGRIDSGIACGSDTTSDAPIALSNSLRKVLLAINSTQSKLRKLALIGQLPLNLGLDIPRNREARTGKSMGEHQAITTAQWGISREDQDALALFSHQKLAQAYKDRFFRDLVSEYEGLTQDKVLRPQLSAHALQALRPVFGKDGDNPTMTAGNSTPLTDGAAAVLLSSDQWAAKHGVEPLAHIKDIQWAAVDYVSGAEGLLMAPTRAVAELLHRNNLTLADIDFFEIHEAFAATVLCHIAAWESPAYCQQYLGLPGALGSVALSKVNPRGSSLATGHPFAATGARILATAAQHIAVSGAELGLISICAAGGQGVAALITR